MAEDLQKLGIAEKSIGILGLHVGNLFPVGTVATTMGPLTASTDNFDITITGYGGHAGLPQDTADAISIGAQFITAMESFMSRKIDPFENAVCSVGTFHAGMSRNIVAEKVTITGTIRCMQEKNRTFIPDNMRKTLQGICDSRGTGFEL